MQRTMRWATRGRSEGSRPGKAVGVAALVVTALLLLTGTASAAETWFGTPETILTKTIKTGVCGEPTKTRELVSEGGQAVDLFDVNGDGIPDIVIVNASNDYFVDLGKRNAQGVVEYSKEATAYPVAEEGSGKTEKILSLGLADFKRNGKLDLYLGNNGKGTLYLKTAARKKPEEWNKPENIETNHLCTDNRFRTFINNGNGTFSYENLGEEAEGVTRTPLFADFGDEGRQDLLALNAPYYGIWWGNGSAPSSLLPGEPDGKFGKNILPESIVNEKGEPEPSLFEEQRHRGDIDIKGGVVRDFTGNGKPDVIAAALSDVAENNQTAPIGAALPEGANVELEPGVPAGGYQGAWSHGILVLRNVSTPGHIRFVNESASATNIGLGLEAGMEPYEVMPVDLNHDGKLDLVVIGLKEFNAVNAVQDNMPVVQVFKNVSTENQIRFENVTAESGLQWMNEPAALETMTNKLYPFEIPGELVAGLPPVLNPNLESGAAIDLSNSGNPDLVFMDRQLVSANPYTKEEFFPWVFENLGNFKFRWVKPAESGLKGTGRDLSYGDIDGNGREDIVTANAPEGAQTKGNEKENNNNVWTNNINNGNNWIELHVRSASDALGPLGLGAKVIVYRAGTSEIIGDEEMRTDFGYRSKRDAVLHFGLGTASAVDVRVEGEGLGTPVTVDNVPIDQLDTITLAPEAPVLTSGASPNDTGQFTLSWAGPGGNNAGFTYTLEHKSASGTWSKVASGLTKPEYAFTGGSPESEGTWTYRVSATYEGTESEPSPASQEIKVDETAPGAPSATPDRAPDYSGGGGWYKNDVTVSFTETGDPTLVDGSPGSGVDPSSITSPETFTTDGAHQACGTVRDLAGNESHTGCVTVQVDATPPTLQLNCPATAILDTIGVAASFSASDGQSGLASASSGSVPIPTDSLGEQTVSETALDNVGHETTESCTTDVVYALSNLAPRTGRRYKSGHVVSVKFVVKDALGYVTDASATLELAPITGGVAGAYEPATSSSNSGDRFKAEKHGRYAYSLATAHLEEGEWSLRINLSDGTTRTTRIVIR